MIRANRFARIALRIARATQGKTIPKIHMGYYPVLGGSFSIPSRHKSIHAALFFWENYFQVLLAVTVTAYNFLEEVTIIQSSLSR